MIFNLFSPDFVRVWGRAEAAVVAWAVWTDFLMFGGRKFVEKLERDFAVGVDAHLFRSILDAVGCGRCHHVLILSLSAMGCEEHLCIDN